MKFIIETIKDVLRLIFWYPVRWISSIVPRYFLMKIGGISGYFLYLFASQRRKIINEEITKCFPKFSKEKCRNLTVKAFQSFIKDQLEVLLYPYLTAEKTSEISIIQGEMNLKNALEKGKGVIVLLNHQGLNQFIMPALGFKGYVIGQVSLPADAVKHVFGNQRISFIHLKMLQLKRQMEETLPSTHIFLENNIWDGLKWLKNGKILAIAVDGRHGERFIETTLCKRQAQFSPSPFIMSLRSGAPLLPVFVLRNENNRHNIIIEKPLIMPEKRVTNKNSALLNEYLAHFENYLEKCPEQYGMFIYLAKIHTGGAHNTLFLDWNN